MHAEMNPEKNPLVLNEPPRDHQGSSMTMTIPSMTIQYHSGPSKNTQDHSEHNTGFDGTTHDHPV